MDNLSRIEKVVAGLPEAERVDVAEWGDHPTFRVRGKNFIFCDGTGSHLTVTLTKDEAAAVVATDPAVEPCGYGLGRHGWISVSRSGHGRVPPAGGRSRSGSGPPTPWSPPAAWPAWSNLRSGAAGEPLRQFPQPCGQLRAAGLAARPLPDRRAPGQAPPAV